MKCSILLFLFFLGFGYPAKVEDIGYLEPLNTLKLSGLKRGESLKFRAHNKEFVLNLVPHSELFHPEIKFTYLKGGQTHRFEYDTTNLFTGEGFVDQQLSHFSLRVDWEKNHLTGIIKTSNESFGVEPAEHFYEEAKDFQTVIYKSTDVKQQKHSCGVSKHEVRTPLTLQVEKRQTTKDTCTVAMVADSRLFVYLGKSLIDTTNNLVDVLAGSEVIFRKQSVAGFQLATVTIYTDANSDPFRSASTSHTTFLDKLNSVKSSILPASKCVVHARTYYNFNGVLGYAQVGAICASGGAPGITTANSFGKTSNMFTQINAVAHEIGHNFGANHDSTSNNLMYPSLSDSTNPQFSSISLTAIKSVMAASASKCFIAKSISGIGKCGNGWLDDGEECDCGVNCSNSSFCTSTCTLKAGYQCDPSNGECCSSSGHFLPQGTQCSAAPYPGVSAPTCSGSSGTCPSCYPGLTHPCDAYSNISPCNYQPCKAGCQFNGQTKCYPATAIQGITTANLPDGTCCPGGTCQSGVCVGSANPQIAVETNTRVIIQDTTPVTKGSTAINQETTPINQETAPLVTEAITPAGIQNDPYSSKNSDTKSDKTPLVLILAPAVGGGALLCIVISIIVTVLIWRRKKAVSKVVEENEMGDKVAAEYYVTETPPDTPTLPTAVTHAF